MMEAAMVEANWAGFVARRAKSEACGKLRGIGMAIYTECCGGGLPEMAEVVFNADDMVTLVMGNQEYGTGLLPTMYCK